MMAATDAPAVNRSLVNVRDGGVTSTTWLFSSVRCVTCNSSFVGWSFMVAVLHLFLPVSPDCQAIPGFTPRYRAVPAFGMCRLFTPARCPLWLSALSLHFGLGQSIFRCCGAR